MPTTATVRRAGPDDAGALAGLRWRWRADERGEAGLDRTDFEVAFAGWMADHAASHTPWLAEMDGSAIGMAWLALVERIPGPQHWTRTAGNLQSVYVVPEQRGHGAGGRLLAAVIDHARAQGMDYLSVHPSARAFSLYRRAGFEESPGVLELRWR